MMTSAGWVAPPGGLPLPLLLLAAALLVADSRSVPRLCSVAGTTSESRTAESAVLRRRWIVVAVCAAAAAGWAAGDTVGALVGGGTGAAGGWVLWRATTRENADTDLAALAGAWELLAVCLRAGLPVATAVAAAAAPLAGPAGHHLRRVAGLLELGADPARAWRDAEGRPSLSTFARAAARSAGTGSALAQVAHAETTRLRGDLLDAAEARAQRAAVLITGPLGLCFLPAFLVLGIAPVVIGLAGQALARW